MQNVNHKTGVRDILKEINKCKKKKKKIFRLFVTVQFTLGTPRFLEMYISETSVLLKFKGLSTSSFKCDRLARVIHKERSRNIFFFFSSVSRMRHYRTSRIIKVR